MARQAAAEKLGFYPAPLEAIDMIAHRVTADPDAVIVDPCAGEGEAVAYLADKLGVSRDRIVASELEGFRSAALSGRLPTSRVSKSTDFQSAYFPRHMATLLYLNPPFDNEAGHLSHRCELTFLARATSMLRTGGVLAMILPANRVPEIRTFVHNWYTQANKYEFPERVRRFREVIVLATKRKKPLFDQYADHRVLEYPYNGAVYHAGPGKLFEIEKQQYTDQELEKLLKVDPLLNQSVAFEHRKASRPPLQLGIGHVALLLAAGHLNGRVHKKGEPPHVVRGTSRKVEVTKETIVAGNDTTAVMQEKIELVIRKVDQRGVIEELTNDA